MTKIFYTLILLSLMTLSAAAQGVVKDIKAENVKLEKVGNDIKINFDLNIPEAAVNRNYKLTLVPVIFNDSSKRKLTPIIVGSRRTKIIDLREGNTPLEGAYYTSNAKILPYSITVPYHSWMNRSSLRIDRFVERCNNQSQLPSTAIVSDMEFVKEVTHAVIEMVVHTPKIDLVAKRWEFENREVIIDFRVNSPKIDALLNNNSRTLEDIIAAMRLITNDKNKQINNIEITGHASPEGPLQRNMQLAEQRARALKKYIRTEVPSIQESDFKIINGGVNWHGLRQMLADSNMPHKVELLNIIDNVPVEINYQKNTSRMKQLMDFKGGVPYNYMLKTFYPRLRTACYIVIYYDVLGDRAADVINESVILISEKRYEQALSKLLPYRSDARAWNSIGVCYMMTDRLDEAKEYLGKAVENGDKSAKENLNIIELMQQAKQAEQTE